MKIAEIKICKHCNSEIFINYQEEKHICKKCGKDQDERERKDDAT